MSNHEEIEEQQYQELRNSQVPKRQVHKKGFSFKYLPYAVLTSLLTVLLFTTVGGCDLEADLGYFVFSYAVGVILLTVAYTNVVKWCKTQKSSRGSAVLFSLFYNNAFYVFSLILCSSVIFSGLIPRYNLILSQVISVGLPAWLSTLQV